jgi:hypothetical protein
MLVALEKDLQGKPQTMAHCADMQDMNTVDKSATKSSNKSSCDISCCMSFVTTTFSTLIPIAKSASEFQQIPAQSPSRFSHVNYRPPILS